MLNRQWFLLLKLNFYFIENSSFLLKKNNTQKTSN